MITIEHDIVVGDILLWLRGNLYDSFGSIGNVHHVIYALFFVKRASEPVAIRVGSKMKCIEFR